MGSNPDVDRAFLGQDHENLKEVVRLTAQVRRALRDWRIFSTATNRNLTGIERATVARSLSYLTEWLNKHFGSIRVCLPVDDDEIFEDLELSHIFPDSFEISRILTALSDLVSRVREEFGTGYPGEVSSRHRNALRGLEVALRRQIRHWAEMHYFPKLDWQPSSIDGWPEVLVDDPDHATADKQRAKTPHVAFSPVQNAILSVLRSHGARLTTSGVMNKLAEARQPFGESSVKPALADLARFKFLTKDRDADPPGYGLPEWEQVEP